MKWFLIVLLFCSLGLLRATKLRFNDQRVTMEMELAALHESSLRNEQINYVAGVRAGVMAFIALHDSTGTQPAIANVQSAAWAMRDDELARFVAPAPRGE